MFNLPRQTFLAQPPLTHSLRAFTVLVPHGCPPCPHSPPRRRTIKTATGDGDFGARDPYEAENSSNFADKVLGNADTSHIIRGPEALGKLVGLTAKRCVPCEGGKVEKLSEADANRLRNQVAGWRLEKGEGDVLCLKQEWKVRNFKAGLELFQRIAQVAEAEGHHPDLHLEGYDHAYAELSTHSIGGLTENDFIMAAKINAVEFGDLLPQKKPRFWA